MSAATGGRLAGDARRGPFSADDVFWLIRLRWYALAGVLAVIGTCYWLRLVPTVAELLLVTGVMAATNLVLWKLSHLGLKEFTRSSLEKAVVPQLVLDLGALAALLHFAGGVENPFVMFFAFHMAIGAMFLRPPLAWGVGMGGGLIHGSVVTGELFQVVPHHHLAFAFGRETHPDLHVMAAFVAGYLVAFLLMLAGVIYFVQTVAERTRRVEALRQAHENIAMSRERLARVGEISAGVAHAIRNPLHGLFNCLDMLRRKAGSANDWADEKYELMAEGLQRIDRVTQRLLALSREGPLRPVPTDLGPLLTDALRFVEGPAYRHDVRLVTDLEPIPPIRLDPDRFSEALINLLENALNACPTGGTITLRARRRRQPVAAVCVEIEDDGPGIAPEHLDKIFDPFFTTKAVGEGSGLGLAIARQVIEGHGGRIKVTSRTGRGTKVRLEVPFEAGQSV